MTLGGVPSSSAQAICHAATCSVPEDLAQVQRAEIMPTKKTKQKTHLPESDPSFQHVVDAFAAYGDVTGGLRRMERFSPCSGGGNSSRNFRRHPSTHW